MENEEARSVKTETVEGRVESVLFATDFSDNASVAMKWALSLALRHGASVSVLHVAPVITMTSLPLDIQANIDRSLEMLASMGRDARVQMTTSWQTGRPWQVISAEAQEHDLVVIGARGHAPFPQLRLGSTADRVVRTATVPVLTIHQQDTAHDRPPRRILVPTDFSELSSRALDAVQRFFRPAAGGALDITLLHVWQPLVEYGDTYGGMPLPSPYADTEEQAEQLLQALAAKVRSTSINVSTMIQPGYPARMIREVAEAMHPDLMAMGTHGHSGLTRFMLGSVAERVVHGVQCPVLSVGLAACERAEAMRAQETAEVAAAGRLPAQAPVDTAGCESSRRGHAGEEEQSS